jgi:hypothetical protein
MRRSTSVQSLTTGAAGLLLAVAIPLAGPAAALSVATVPHVSAPTADNPFGGGSSGGGGASGGW